MDQEEINEQFFKVSKHLVYMSDKRKANTWLHAEVARLESMIVEGEDERL